MTRAFAYLRVSGKGQLDRDGFPRQIETIKRYAATYGVEIIRIFQEALTGTSDLEDRPALVDLLAALEANGTQLVLVEKLDRLARDLMVQETILADIQKRGFEIVSVMEPDLCQTDPTRVMMRQIFGAISQYEKCMIVLKLRGARQRKKAEVGRCEGRKPYGFYADEVVTLGRIRSLRAAGSGFEQIALTLNSEGLKPRTGARWWGRTVNNILGREK